MTIHTNKFSISLLRGSKPFINIYYSCYKKNHTSSLWLVDFIIVCREITILGTCSMSTDVGSRGTCQVHGSALLAQLCSHKVVNVTTTTTTTTTESDC
jgi:hypothetical protein